MFDILSCAVWPNFYCLKTEVPAGQVSSRFFFWWWVILLILFFVYAVYIQYWSLEFFKLWRTFGANFAWPVFYWFILTWFYNKGKKLKRRNQEICFPGLMVHREWKLNSLLIFVYFVSTMFNFHYYSKKLEKSTIRATTIPTAFVIFIRWFMWC